MAFHAVSDGIRPHRARWLGALALAVAGVSALALQQAAPRSAAHPQHGRCKMVPPDVVAMPLATPCDGPHGLRAELITELKQLEDGDTISADDARLEQLDRSVLVGLATRCHRGAAR